MVLTDDESGEGSTDEEAEDAAGAIETVLASSGAISRLASPLDASGPCFEGEDGCYVEVPPPSLLCCEQEGANSAFA